MSHPNPAIDYFDQAEYETVEFVSDVTNEFGNVDEYRETFCSCPDINFVFRSRTSHGEHHDLDCDRFQDNYEKSF